MLLRQLTVLFNNLQFNLQKPMQYGNLITDVVIRAPPRQTSTFAVYLPVIMDQLPRVKAITAFGQASELTSCIPAHYNHLTLLEVEDWT